MSHLPIWYMGQVPAEICDKAVADFSTIPAKEATMGADGEEFDHGHRNTTVHFAGPDHWFEDYLTNVALLGNRACGWEYHVTGNEAHDVARALALHEDALDRLDQVLALVVEL